MDCEENSPLAPVAIFLSTEGLDDCYPIYENEKHLYKLYDEVILDSVISNGFARTRDELRNELLPYLTARGSNDDISLAYFVTRDLNLLKRILGKEIDDTEKYLQARKEILKRRAEGKYNHD